MRHAFPGLLACLFAIASTGGCGAGRDAPVAPAGAPESARTQALEAGAKVLQDNGPLAGFDVHLVGFHPMKDAPEAQMEAHHYCRQVNEDFAQCVLFDGDGAQANLTGIEYIVSERLFAQLPEQERASWHPHNAEILSGQLVAPGLPLAAEHALMRDKLNSYGKTWHTWRSRTGTAPGDRLPLGPAMLAWSFNREGEAQPGMVAARDAALDVSTGQRRENRRDLAPLAHPQEGVDALHGRFARPTRPIPGVRAARASPTANR
ncbi:MAG TPA: OBAP family protein [Xanthomonadaceae bacterium]|nr:OBAP family protein [Xanthomonadaceae bacterium]